MVKRRLLYKKICRKKPANAHPCCPIQLKIQILKEKQIRKINKTKENQ
jgi:hypothetical protein